MNRERKHERLEAVHIGDKNMKQTKTLPTPSASKEKPKRNSLKESQPERIRHPRAAKGL